jgi:hypothetical protein
MCLLLFTEFDIIQDGTFEMLFDSESCSNCSLANSKTSLNQGDGRQSSLHIFYHYMKGNTWRITMYSNSSCTVRDLLRCHGSVNKIEPHIEQVLSTERKNKFQLTRESVVNVI